MKQARLRRQFVGMVPSATLAINERSHAMLAAGQHVFKLGLGQSPFPVPSPVVNALKAAASEKDYLPVSGLKSLRQAIVQHHSRYGDFDRCADDVIVGPGSKELLFLIQLVHRGALLLPNPSWVSYEPQARLIGKRVEWIDTASTGWRLAAESLDAHCLRHPESQKLLILNYPNNPTGLTYGATALAALATVCRVHNIVVISDEIYGRVNHSDTHHSIAQYYPEGTIVCSGLSKWAGAGGWRLGYAVFPPELRPLLNATKSVASETFTSVSAPIQYAAITAFDGGPSIERYLRDSQTILNTLGRECASILRSVGVQVPEPEGGFYLFINLEDHRDVLTQRGIQTGKALAETLLTDRGVACLPGECFGRPASELTLRLSYVDFDGADALHQLNTRLRNQDLSRADIRLLCEPTLRAMDSVADWCKSL